MPVLTEEDRDHFRRHGYVVVPGAVDEDLLGAADAEIDAFVTAERPRDVHEAHGPIVVGDDAEPGQHQWFPDAARLPACDRALRGSDAFCAAHELVAPAQLGHAFDHIQVATTVPPWSHVPGGPHLDGHTEDPPGSFTMLAGIFLTDQTASASGNLWVWPGSHIAHAAMFRERGPGALLPTQGHPTMLDPPVALGAPVEVHGRRGDVLLAHYLLGHNKGGNTSRTTWRTIYYRLATGEHRRRWREALVDPWLDYPTLAQRQGGDT